MSNEELEDAFMREFELRIYTSGIGRFIEGRMCVLHWPATPDAFLVETNDSPLPAPEHTTFYWIQRSDPSLIVQRVSVDHRFG